MTHHWVTMLILTLYVMNILWYSHCGDFGRAWYWFAATQITVCATWFCRF